MNDNRYYWMTDFMICSMMWAFLCVIDSFVAVVIYLSLHLILNLSMVEVYAVMKLLLAVQVVIFLLSIVRKFFLRR